VGWELAQKLTSLVSLFEKLRVCRGLEAWKGSPWLGGYYGRPNWLQNFYRKNTELSIRIISVLLTACQHKEWLPKTIL